MGYNKKNWATGQVITATDLLNIESGIYDNDTEIDAINSSLSGGVYHEIYNGESVEIATSANSGIITSSSIIKIEKVTQAQYDALPSTKNSNNILYIING